MGDPDYFREYHAVEARLRVTRVVAAIAVGASVIAIVTALSAGAPVSPIVSAPTSAPTPTSVAATVLPAPDASAGASAQPTAEPQPQPLPATGPGTWSIAIDTTGYQTEIDQCLWVRMDLGLAAPVVGAHNYCGGSVVLEMAIGDTVTLSGTGLDGTYRVTAERLAQAGDNAAAATEGLAADVILQTCFWADDGSERLIALESV